MKSIFKAAVVATTAFTATSVFAAGWFSRAPDRVGRTYTESSYWSSPRTVLPNEASAGSSYSAPVAVNGPIVTTPAPVAAAPGPTMGPWYPGDNIKNANSALWGVGG